MYVHSDTVTMQYSEMYLNGRQCFGHYTEGIFVVEEFVCTQTVWDLAFIIILQLAFLRTWPLREVLLYIHLYTHFDIVQ